MVHLIQKETENGEGMSVVTRFVIPNIHLFRIRDGSSLIVKSPTLSVHLYYCVYTDFLTKRLILIPPQRNLGSCFVIGGTPFLILLKGGLVEERGERQGNRVERRGGFRWWGTEGKTLSWGSKSDKEDGGR